MTTARRRLVVLHGANSTCWASGRRCTTAPSPCRTGAADAAEAGRLGWDCLCLQTNHEGGYIEYLHEHRRAGAMIVNPGPGPTTATPSGTLSNW